MEVGCCRRPGERLMRAWTRLKGMETEKRMVPWEAELTDAGVGLVLECGGGKHRRFLVF